MMEAWIAGERDVSVMAQMAKGRARNKIAELEEALRGFFTGHHAIILRTMLDNIDRMAAQLTELDRKIETAVTPFAHQIGQLVEIPGLDQIAFRPGRRSRRPCSISNSRPCWRTTTSARSRWPPR